MKLRSLAPALIAAFSVGALPGCFPWWLFEDDDDPGYVITDPDEGEGGGAGGEAVENAAPPSVDNLSLADWPPAGAGTLIAASVSAEAGLTGVRFSFAKDVWVDASGTQDTVSVTGSQIGEGFGTMVVTAFDVRDAWGEQTVTDFLVDLTPPKGELVKSVVRRGEGFEIQAWVGDAWVLGGAELTFGGVTRTHTFQAGYPWTLGNAWDVSLVTFPSTDFPEAKGKAVLRTWDAAGNEITTEVDLTLDGTPPMAGVLSPAPGSTVSGPVSIEVEGWDTGGTPVEIDVFVAGTPVATLPGPLAEVTVDVSELAKGAVQIEAIARDVAGNTSEPAAVDVVIE